MSPKGNDQSKGNKWQKGNSNNYKQHIAATNVKKADNKSEGGNITFTSDQFEKLIISLPSTSYTERSSKSDTDDEIDANFAGLCNPQD